MGRQEGTSRVLSNIDVTIADTKASTSSKKFKEIFEFTISRNSFCPVRDIISRVSDKWSILAMCSLGAYGTLRFNEIKHKIGDISQRMLTVTLRNLEGDGLITRKVFPEVPPRVEYQLTSLGTELLDLLDNFSDWAKKNGGGIIKNRKKYAKKVLK